MHSAEGKVLLISNDAVRCSAFRLALRGSDPYCQVSFVASFAAARHAVASASPDVIVLEEAALHSTATAVGARIVPLADVVSSLAGYAPVVILGSDEPPASLATLIAAGAADFVPSDDADLPKAAACVERRLQAIHRVEPAFCEALRKTTVAVELPEETFGEMLRHELNNPLTGILGNAELLLAETRKNNGAAISATGAKRLETIAALAVRMRETVRRLSQACELPVDPENPAAGSPARLPSSSHLPSTIEPRRK